MENQVGQEVEPVQETRSADSRKVGDVMSC